MATAEEGLRSGEQPGVVPWGEGFFEYTTLTARIPMEHRDLELIERLSPADPELAQLWREHLELEAQLDSLSSRLYLTPEEQVERKRLQKRKLAGRDRIEVILATHRQGAQV